MRFSTRSIPALLCAALLLFPIAARSAESTTLIACVPANANEAFGEVVSAFEAKHPGVNVKAFYGGSQTLIAKLEAGDDADILVSSEQKYTAEARAKGWNAEEFRVLARLSETVIVPKNNPAKISGLKDLANKGVHVILGNDASPIGKYSRAVLAKAAAPYGADFSAKVMANVVSQQTNTKLVLQQIGVGAGDAGIVYSSDVTPAVADRVSAIAIPSDLIVHGENVVAVLKRSKHAEMARAFVEFALSAEGKRIFAKYHFE